jgi:ABC-type bacteriocin/lantibiotic exporter with double-glycine peptidase domain
LVYKQDEPHSCAIACAAMLICRKNLSPPNDIALKKQAAYKGYKYTEGMTLAELSTLLSFHYKINTVQLSDLKFESALQLTEPVVAALMWMNSLVHTVLIDGRDEKGLVVCDPAGSLTNLVYVDGEQEWNGYRGDGMFTGHYLKIT